MLFRSCAVEWSAPLSAAVGPYGSAHSDPTVDDIVIDTSLSGTSGFQIALIGNFVMSDITQGWFSI